MCKHFQYFHVNSIHARLGERKAKALPFFHAFTGSDTTSSFYGRGKKSMWDAWDVYPDVTETFTHETNNTFLPFEPSLFEKIERFVVLAYDKSNSATSVNTAQRQLFTKKTRELENIPPTQVRIYRGQEN
jgi:hypothetical protein